MYSERACGHLVPNVTMPLKTRGLETPYCVTTDLLSHIIVYFVSVRVLKIWSQQSEFFHLVLSLLLSEEEKTDFCELDRSSVSFPLSLEESHGSEADNGCRSNTSAQSFFKHYFVCHLNILRSKNCYSTCTEKYACF